jgi:uncharacterized protein YeaO (DUF488 family)
LVKKEEQKRLKKVKMDEFYSKQGQELKDQEAKEKKEMSDLWNNEHVQKVFSNQEQQFQPIFKQFTMMDKK